MIGPLCHLEPRSLQVVSSSTFFLFPSLPNPIDRFLLTPHTLAQNAAPDLNATSFSEKARTKMPLPGSPQSNKPRLKVNNNPVPQTLRTRVNLVKQLKRLVKLNKPRPWLRLGERNNQSQREMTRLMRTMVSYPTFLLSLVYSLRDGTDSWFFCIIVSLVVSQANCSREKGKLPCPFHEFLPAIFDTDRKIPFRCKQLSRPSSLLTVTSFKLSWTLPRLKINSSKSSHLFFPLCQNNQNYLRENGRTGSDLAGVPGAM